jgi:cephalosporin hydroxylase
MSILKKLSLKHGTDKYEHGFIEVYDPLMEIYKDEVFNFLEIGVFFGSSIEMWNEYFTNAKIFGMDTFEGVQGNGTKFHNSSKYYDEWKNKNLSKIELFKYDQSNENDLEKFVNFCNDSNLKFKFILDDGSHVMRDQQITFEILFDLLEDGGYFIIEDTHSSDQYPYYDILNDFSNTTKKVFEEYKITNKINSIYTIDKERILKIEQNIFSVENIFCKNGKSQTMIIKKK